MSDKPNYKTRFFYGLMVLAPIAAITVLLAQLVEILDKLGKSIGLDSTLSTFFVILLATAGLVLFCYGIGSLIHTRIGAWSFEKFEQLILAQVPGYQIIKNVFVGVSGETARKYKTALIQLGPPGTAVLGFIMEYNENATVTVFIPNSPVLTVGGIHIVEKNRVTQLESGHMDMIACIGEWGVGSSKVIGEAKLPFRGQIT